MAFFWVIMLVLLVAVACVGLVALIVALGRSGKAASTTQSALNFQERKELNDLRNLVDDLKETAWQERELDSMMSTIFIDKIRTYEKQRRELG